MNIKDEIDSRIVDTQSVLDLVRDQFTAQRDMLLARLDALRALKASVTPVIQAAVDALETLGYTITSPKNR
jgi:hypothetical protein